MKDKTNTCGLLWSKNRILRLLDSLYYFPSSCCTVILSFVFCTNIPLWLLCFLSFLSKRKHKRKGLIGSISVLRTVLRIHRVPRPKVFMVMSVSSRQALEHRTQPHLIRTRLFDLLHYPVITQTGYWRTHGLVLITLHTTEGKFQAIKVRPAFIVMVAALCLSPIVAAASGLLKSKSLMNS